MQQPKTIGKPDGAAGSHPDRQQQCQSGQKGRRTEPPQDNGTQHAARKDPYQDQTCRQSQEQIIGKNRAQAR